MGKSTQSSASARLRAALGIGSLGCAFMAWMLSPTRTGNDYTFVLVLLFGSLAVFGAVAWVATALVQWIANRPKAAPPKPEVFDIARHNRDRRLQDAPFTRVVAVAEKLFGWFAAVAAAWLTIAAGINVGIQGESWRWFRRSDSFHFHGPNRWFFTAAMFSASIFVVAGMLCTVVDGKARSRLQLAVRWIGRASVAFLVLSVFANAVLRLFGA
jgi:hypothetical protein